MSPEDNELLSNIPSLFIQVPAECVYGGVGSEEMDLTQSVNLPPGWHITGLTRVTDRKMFKVRFAGAYMVVEPLNLCKPSPLTLSYVVGYDVISELLVLLPCCRSGRHLWPSPWTSGSLAGNCDRSRVDRSKLSRVNANYWIE